MSLGNSEVSDPGYKGEADLTTRARTGRGTNRDRTTVIPGLPIEVNLRRVRALSDHLNDPSSFDFFVPESLFLPRNEDIPNPRPTHAPARSCSPDPHLLRVLYVGKRGSDDPGAANGRTQKVCGDDNELQQRASLDPDGHQVAPRSMEAERGWLIVGR